LANVRHQPRARYWEPGVRKSEYKNRNRHGNPDAHAKTCPDSNANADMGHRCADNCTQ